MKKYLLLAIFPTFLWAIDLSIDNPAKLQLPNHSSPILEKNLTNKIAEKQFATTNDSIIKISKESLLANPKLLKRAMQSVLLGQQIEGIKIVLPIYRQSKVADKLLITYAEALLAHSQGKLKTAIKHYRHIIAQEPDMSVVRLNLSMALYADRQGLAARDQLLRLQSSKNLPKSIKKLIKTTIYRIEREEEWKFNTSFYYRQENNINNAPTQRSILYGKGTLTFPKPEKAQGIHLELGAKKRFNLDNHWYNKLQVNVSSDFFWNNHRYDDLTLRTGLVFGYQTSKLTIETEPFVNKRFYGTTPYSLTTGINSIISYQPSTHWKLYNTLSWSYEDFDKKTFLNGQRHFIGLSAHYTPKPQQYWLVGFNYHNSKAKNKEDSFHRTSLLIGWGQEWPKGLSSHLALSASQRSYNGVDFFNIKRKDKEYAAKLSLWHRGVHYWGITPRLVWSWDKVDSNHFYHKQQNSAINVEFSKAF